MTLSIVPTDELGINNLAQGMTGFLDADEEALQQSMMTTLFIGGASAESGGRAAYLLMDDGSKLHVPNTLRCWIVDLKIVEQRYQDFDPVDKLLIRVTAADGSSYIYRTSLNSWTASRFLQNFKYMTRQQLSDQVMITLVPKGRAFHRVEIPKSEFGSGKMGYDDMLDAISHTNGTAQDNEDSPVIEAQVTTEAEPFEVPESELDELIDEIKAEKLPAKRKRSTVAEALETTV
jgi:hypothetical protein